MARMFGRVVGLVAAVLGLLLVSPTAAAARTRPSSVDAPASVLVTLRAYTIDAKHPPQDSCSPALPFVDQVIASNQVGLCVETPNLAPLGSFRLTEYDTTSGYYNIELYEDDWCMHLTISAEGVGSECIMPTGAGTTLAALQFQLLPTFQPGQWQLDFSHSPYPSCFPSAYHAPVTPNACSSTVVPVTAGTVYLSQLFTMDGPNTFNLTLFTNRGCDPSGGVMEWPHMDFIQCYNVKDYPFRVLQTPSRAAAQAHAQKATHLKAHDDQLTIIALA